MERVNEAIRAGDVKAPVYNLKAVVKETGLNPATLRAWERRYGMPQPQRTEGGHRQYCQHDIDTLHWLITRQEEGMSIGNAAKLWQTLNDQGQNPLLEFDTSLDTKPVVAGIPGTSSEITKLREAWVEACLAFDRSEAEQTLARAFALFPPEVVCVELMQAGLAAIGALWYEGQATIQQEHFASAMSIQRLDMLIAATAPPTRPERIIIAAAEDDFHIFSPLLFTFLLRRRGWDVLYLGADMPTASLVEMVEQVKPHLLIVSAQTLATATSLLDVTEAVDGDGTIVGYGGIVFNMIPKLQERIPAHYLGPTIDGAVAVVERLIRTGTPNPSAAGQAYDEALRQFKQQRSRIESSVWNSFFAEGNSREKLQEMNEEMAGIITAALRFGVDEILGRQMAWHQHLANSYRISDEEAQAYLSAYQKAANTHLGGAGQMVADSLAKMPVD